MQRVWFARRIALEQQHYDNYKESESTYFQYQNALALVLSAAQLCKFKEEDSHEAERGHSGISALALAL